MATKPATKKVAAKRPAVTTRSARAAAAQQGPLYRALADSFIDNVYVKQGQTVVYYGLPGSQLLALNDEAKERKRAVRDIRLDSDLDVAGKAAALKELSDEWNGVVRADEVDFAESEANLDDDDEPNPGRPGRAPLPAAERAELERQALAGQAAQKAKEADDTNRVTVKLSGVTDPTPAELQGSTPALDAAGKTDAARAAADKAASGKTDTAGK